MNKNYEVVDIVSYKGWITSLHEIKARMMLTNMINNSALIEMEAKLRYEKKNTENVWRSLYASFSGCSRVFSDSWYC